jgi:hypothetical protein
MEAMLAFHLLGCMNKNAWPDKTQVYIDVFNMNGIPVVHKIAEFMNIQQVIECLNNDFRPLTKGAYIVVMNSLYGCKTTRYFKP